MSDSFDNQNYNAQSFGSPMQEAPKSNRNRNLMLACGGCFAILLVVCCCCAGAGYFSVRQPVGLATWWGTFIAANSYETARMVVCDGSPAEAYTATLERQGATFSNFSVNQNVGDDAVASGTLKIGNESSTWSATFIGGDGGTLGRCIDRIEVD